MRYFITPHAASRSKALPPDNKITWIIQTFVKGFNNSDSCEEGHPPLTFWPIGAPFLKIKTVQPAATDLSSAFSIKKLSP